jgi:integrase
MYFILRLTTGMRGREAMDLTLYHLRPDLSGFSYRVDKPKTNKRKQVRTEYRKHRRIVLDPWVKEQLGIYLRRYCREVNGIWISPFPSQKLFPWDDMAIIDAYWHKLRHKMKRAGFDSHRLEKMSTRGSHQKPTYVIRPHILRHFYASVMYVKFRHDIKRVQEEIKHSESRTTDGYVHSPAALNSTEEYLLTASWAKILGYEEAQSSLVEITITSQTSLDLF